MCPNGNKEQVDLVIYLLEYVRSLDNSASFLADIFIGWVAPVDSISHKLDGLETSGVQTSHWLSALSTGERRILNYWRLFCCDASVELFGCRTALIVTSICLALSLLANHV